MTSIPALRPVFTYSSALYIPGVSTCISVCEIATKLFLLLFEGYSDQIGQTYRLGWHRYYIEKPMADMVCDLFYGFGGFGRHLLHIYRAEKGNTLFEKAQQDPTNRISLLQEAAHQYRHKEAIYQLATAFRDGKGVVQDLDKAKALFEAGDALGHPGSSVALGQLYSTGTCGGNKAQAIHTASTFFKKVSTPFAQYLLEVFTLLETCDAEPVCTFIQGFKDRFATNFSETADQEDLAVALGKAVQNGLNIYHEMKDRLFNCAIKHLPRGPQKAEAHFHLKHLKEAAILGHVQAILEYTEQLRLGDDTSVHSDARRLLMTIPEALLTGDTHVLLGLCLLSGFGSDTCDPTQAAAHFEKAHSKLNTVHTSYFKGLADVLTLCQPNELTLLSNTFLEIGPLRWSTTIPLASESVAFEDLALALGSRIVDTACSMDDRLFEAKKSLALKLLTFTQQQALPLLAKREALHQQAKLHNVSETVEDEIRCYKTYLTMEPEDVETREILYSLLLKKGDKKAYEHLKFAAEGGDVQAQYLYGSYLWKQGNQEQRNQPRGVLQVLSFGNQPEPNGHMIQGKGWLLKAAQKGHDKAETVCKQYGWVKAGSGAGSSRRSVRTVQGGYSENPPPYDRGDNRSVTSNPFYAGGQT